VGARVLNLTQSQGFEEGDPRVDPAEEAPKDSLMRVRSCRVAIRWKQDISFSLGFDKSDKAFLEGKALIFFLLITTVHCTTVEPQKADFINRKIHLGTKTYPYVVYVPPAHEKSRRLPILLFLHGAGERGNDRRMQTQVGVGPAIRKNPERFKELIVV
jgi:hypothetical protein